MINLTKEQQAQADKIMSKISLAKDKSTLESHVVNLSKCVVDLSKSSNVDLCDKEARVILVLDYSGSMEHLYDNGTIQNTLNRLAPLGLTFDDNGALEVYLFQNICRKLPDMTLGNYADYKRLVIDTSGFRMGGTRYAPPLEAILQDTGKQAAAKKTHIFGIKSKASTVKKTGETVLVIFVTDGENSDKSDTDAIIRESSKSDIFIQFIGIGNSSFNYLEKLDNLDGRDIDNTGFTNLTDLDDTSDDELYRVTLEEFANWLKNI